MEISLQTESHEEQKKKVWPKTGRHILANFDEESIIVYQAFSQEIADYAVKNGRFGGPKYSHTRMTWIKTSFLWMMYRAGWATKHNQEHILALRLTRDGFEEILRSAREGKAVPGSHDHGEGPDEVRLQWDPDHSPSGGNMERRAIQLGLRGNILTRFHQEWLVRIEDITDFVKEQYQFVQDKKLEKLVTPRERAYIPSDTKICRHIRLYDFDQNDNDGTETAELTTQAVDKSSDLSAEGACCTELLEPQFSKTSEDGHSDDVMKDNGCTNEVIISLGGAFNPVHTRHVQVMLETKKWMEEEMGYKVVAGVLAAAPDGYVRSKCRKTKQRGIKIDHRIRMCEIACQSYDWLKPYRKATGSANQGGEVFQQENGLVNARIAVIVGADRAVNKSGKARWHSNRRQMTVCAGRVGETAKMMEAYEEDKQEGKVKNSEFFILPKELDNVSSTDVRGKLRFDACKKETAVKELVDLGWIDAKVGEFILQNEQDLYFN